MNDKSGNGKSDTYRPRTLSPSSAGTFRNCNRRWKFHYVDDLPDPPGEAALMGTFVHKILEHLLALPAYERTLGVARRLCTENWLPTALNPEFQTLKLDPTQHTQFKQDLWNFIEGYFRMFDPTKVEVIGLEQNVKSMVGEVPFAGVVDLLEKTDEGLRVTDYKTGKPPGKRFVDNALSQIWLYAAAVTDDDTEIASVQLAYIGNGFTKQGKTLVREMDQVAMGAAVERHGKTWDEIHTALDAYAEIDPDDPNAPDPFKPLVGPLCGWCPYRANCPEGTAEYERRQSSYRR